METLFDIFKILNLFSKNVRENDKKFIASITPVEELKVTEKVLKKRYWTRTL